MPKTDLPAFLEAHVKTVEPLLRNINLAYWDATISGAPADFEHYAALLLDLQKIYSNPTEFDLVRKWKNDPRITNPLERRQIDLLYDDYLRNQIDPVLNETITKLASKIENQFSVYRATLDGRTVTTNDILEILVASDDAALKKRAWQAGKDVAGVVEKDLLTLVRLRNEAAESLGYDNFYSMSLDLNEQSEDAVVALFEEIDQRTREPFETLKAEIDDRVAARYSVRTADLRPWHYDDLYFQEAPRVLDVDLDQYYAGNDILEVVSRFYGGIGLDVGDILARSDLYEKPGKDQHAYCTDIDRRGDIRILANIKSNETWMGTMLHELGHGVYDKYIDRALPYLLRHEAHILTTEAVAMMFGRLSKDAIWIRDAVGVTEEEAEDVRGKLVRHTRIAQLIFARWALVMMNFERALYMNPEQDLNRLWWSLAERYQAVTPPPDRDFPDWAAKNHIVSAPVYYHNYLLGEILASQLTHFIRANVLAPNHRDRSFCGQPEVGEYLKQHVFKPGARMHWDTMILTPAYFVRQFVD
ncbi:MAG: M2 family metallopeptidase [bacterium]